MKRQIVLDTETTGLDPGQGHRIIEIGCVELVNRQLTHRHYHVFLDPEREIDEGATSVHGHTWDDLRGKQKFRDIAAELLDFIRGAELVIHNAAFDTEFLDYELALAGFPALSESASEVVDTLKLARELHPGKRNNLDALCERFGISNAHRTLHGALLDAQLLAEVYLAMTRGQDSLTIDIAVPAAARLVDTTTGAPAELRAPLPVLIPTQTELLAHRAYLESLDRESKGRCIWLALESAAAA